MRDGNDSLFSLNLAASSSAGDRLHLAQEHLGAGLVGADADAVSPDQASADLDIVEAKFNEFETTPCT